MNPLWQAGELWIPYDPAEQALQQALMDRMLNTGQYLYKDAKVLVDRDGQRFHFWILRRPSVPFLKRAMNGRVLNADSVESKTCSHGMSDWPEHTTTADCVGREVRNLKMREAEAIIEGSSCRLRIHVLCRRCRHRCKQADIPNGEMLCYDFTSRRK